MLVIDERKLLFWKKMFLSTNVILRAVSCTVCNRFLSVCSKYGHNGMHDIKVWHQGCRVAVIF